MDIFYAVRLLRINLKMSQECLKFNINRLKRSCFLADFLKIDRYYLLKQLETSTSAKIGITLALYLSKLWQKFNESYV